MSQQQKDGFFFHPHVKSKQARQGRGRAEGQRAACLSRPPLKSLSHPFGLALIGAESTGGFYRDEPHFKRTNCCIVKVEGRKGASTYN